MNKNQKDTSLGVIMSVIAVIMFIGFAWYIVTDSDRVIKNALAYEQENIYISNVDGKKIWKDNSGDKNFQYKEWDGHRYVVYSDGYRCITGIVHDPNCPFDKK